MLTQFDDVLAHSILNCLFGAATLTPPATWYLAALKSGDVEVTATGYARKAITNNGTNFPNAASRTKLLAVAQDFIAANPGVDWGTVESLGLYTASSGGTRQAKIQLAGVPKYFTAGTDDILRSTAHGYVDGQPLRAEALPGIALPTNLAAATTVYARDITTDTFKVAATPGAAAIDLTAAGGGLIYAWRAKPVSDGDILGFAANELSIAFA